MGIAARKGDNGRWYAAQVFGRRLLIGFAGPSARPVVLVLVAGPDFDAEIKQLQATMSTIGQVLDLDAMRAEIADLGEQVAAPDLWDDQDNATRVTGRLSVLQGELDRFTEPPAAGSTTSAIMVELGHGGGRRRRARRGRDRAGAGSRRPSRRSRSAPSSPASTTPARRW